MAFGMKTEGGLQGAEKPSKKLSTWINSASATHCLVNKVLQG
jgi:hypothetical protein